MWIHYDNEEAAWNHLDESGWTESKKGPWLWFKSGIIASIHPVPGTAKVVVCYREKV